MLTTKLFANILVLLTVFGGNAFAAPSIRQIGQITSSSTGSATPSVNNKARAATPMLQKMTTTGMAKTGATAAIATNPDSARLVGKPVSVGVKTIGGTKTNSNTNSATLLNSLNSQVQILQENLAETMQITDNLDEIIAQETAGLASSDQVARDIASATSNMVTFGTDGNLNDKIADTSTITSMQASINAKPSGKDVADAISEATANMVTSGTNFATELASTQLYETVTNSQTGLVTKTAALETKTSAIENKFNKDSSGKITTLNAEYVPDNISSDKINGLAEFKQNINDKFSADGSIKVEKIPSTIARTADVNTAIGNMEFKVDESDQKVKYKLTNEAGWQDLANVSDFGGTPGKSAYQSWQDLGHTGTEEQFVASLQGTDGKSAYQSWKDLGHTGTEEQFVASLQGTDGKSAYQSWKDLGHTGTEEQFVASLQGTDGKSAYQSWLDAGNTGSENEFIASLGATCAADDIVGVRIEGNKMFTKKCGQTTETETDLPTGATCAEDDVVGVRIEGNKMYTKKCGQTTETETDLPTGATCAEDDIVGVRVEGNKMYTKKCGQTTETETDLPTGATCAEDDVVGVRIEGNKMYTKKCGQTTETETDLPTGATCAEDDIVGVRVEGNKMYTKKCGQTTETETDLPTGATCAEDDVVGVRIEGNKMYTKKCGQTTETETDLPTGATCAEDDVVGVRIEGSKMYTKKCGQTTETETEIMDNGTLSDKLNSLNYVQSSSLGTLAYKSSITTSNISDLSTTLSGYQAKLSDNQLANIDNAVTTGENGNIATALSAQHVITTNNIPNNIVTTGENGNISTVLSNNHVVTTGENGNIATALSAQHVITTNNIPNNIVTTGENGNIATALSAQHVITTNNIPNNIVTTGENGNISTVLSNNHVVTTGTNGNFDSLLENSSLATSVNGNCKGEEGEECTPSLAQQIANVNTDSGETTAALSLVLDALEQGGVICVTHGRAQASTGVGNITQITAGRCPAGD